VLNLPAKVPAVMISNVELASSANMVLTVSVPASLTD
jgi:hypothetical protein